MHTSSILWQGWQDTCVSSILWLGRQDPCEHTIASEERRLHEYHTMTMKVTLMLVVYYGSVLWHGRQDTYKKYTMAR